MRLGTPLGGMERVEAYFAGHAFLPHRHDTYALGYTLTERQCFSHRGVGTASVPGHAIVLHPDEPHDGRAGADEGFRYRMIYVPPRDLSAALSRRPAALPFVHEAVRADARLLRALVAALGDLDETADDLAVTTLVVGLADALEHASGTPTAPVTADTTALTRVADVLSDTRGPPPRAEQLETISGLDRFSLTRQFRRTFGTSPDRFRVLLRLEAARARIVRGEALAEIAAECGFADQAHMTRQFAKAYGIAPGRFRQLLSALPSPAPSRI
jgi:AraC-like DNA-binding protein